MLVLADKGQEEDGDCKGDVINPLEAVNRRKNQCRAMGYSEWPMDGRIQLSGDTCLSWINSEEVLYGDHDKFLERFDGIDPRARSRIWELLFRPGARMHEYMALAIDAESPIEVLLGLELEAFVQNLNYYHETGMYWKLAQQVRVERSGKAFARLDFLLAASEHFPDNQYPVQWGPPKTLVAIECDGHDYHERTKEQAKRDKSRDRQMMALGVQTLRFTGSEIFADPTACAADVFDVSVRKYL